MTDRVRIISALEDMHGPTPGEIRDAVVELRRTCTWKFNDAGIFETGCGYFFYFDDEGDGHGLIFCGYCGGTIR